MEIEDSGNQMGEMEQILIRYYEWNTVYNIPQVGKVQRSHIRAMGDKKLCEDAQVRYKIGTYKIHKIPDGQYILIDLSKKWY